MNHKECIHYEICERFLHWRFHEIKECKRFMEKPKHGEWVKNAELWDYNNPPYICSECGNSHLRETPFCDICGADMRKHERGLRATMSLIDDAADAKPDFECIIIGDTIYTQDSDKQGWTGREEK